MKMKKWLMSLGTLASVTMPVVAAVSCGSEIVKDKDGNVLMTYESSSKTVYFNLNKEKSEQIDTSSVQLKRFLDPIVVTPKRSTTIEVNRETFININDAFQKATDPRFSNIDSLKDGDVVHVIFTGQYQKESVYQLNAGEGFVKRPMIKINFTMGIDFNYSSTSEITYPLMKDLNGRYDSTDPDQRDKERIKVRSNFIESLIEGMQKYQLFTKNNWTARHFFPVGGSRDKTDTSVAGSETAETYVKTKISNDNVLGLLTNNDPTVSNAFKNPRNYETTVTLPKIDLTKALVNNVSLDDTQIKHSGNVESGFHLSIPMVSSSHAVIPGGGGSGITEAQCQTFMKKLALANKAKGFFKTEPTATVQWNGTPYSNSTAGATHATVTFTGQDWNGDALIKTYEVYVTTA